MKHKTALISIFVLLFLSAFSQNFRPLLALPLPEGRTLDEGHDVGFIDWSGSVGYVNLKHKDGICPSPCVEQVTRIYDGSAVSGTFAPVDVVYFEVMVAFTHDSNAGIAILNACGSSDAWNLYVGPGSGLPGFVSMSVPVPAGCTAWSLSASGGYVDFRSVDANYVSPPPPVSTNTFTPVPTETFTPSSTATDTLTPTATETLAPGVTPSDTPSPTLTSTPSATLPPGVTPSDTPVPSNTPIPPAPTNTPVQPPPSGGGQGGSGGFVLPTATFTQTAFLLPTPTDTPHPSTGSGQALTPDLVETARVMIFGTSTPTPKPVGKAGKAGSGFPWWLLAAGGAAMYAAGKRKQIAQGFSKYFGKKTRGTPGAQEAASKRGQVRAESEAVNAKVTRMEAEEERRAAQRPTVQPKSTVLISGTHNFARRPKPVLAQPAKPSLWSRFTSGMKTLAAPLVNTVQKPVAPIAQPSLWNRFTSAVRSTVKKVAPVVNTVKIAVSNGWKAMRTTAVNAWNTVKTIPSTVKTTVVHTWNAVKTRAVNVWNTIKTKTADTWNMFKTKAVNAWNTVKTTVSNAWNSVKTVATNVWNTVKTKLQNGWNTLKTWARNVSRGVGSFFRKHPVIAWGTATGLTLGAAVGARNLYCYGSLLPPVSALDLTSWFALPLAGLLTTDKRHRRYGLFVGLLFCGMILSACGPQGGSPTPAISLCPEPPTQIPSPTQTPNPPTETPTPWLSVITDLNALYSKWTDSAGVVYSAQNDYNWAFANASGTYSVPAWILKALAAHESSFDPFASNDIRAVGLTGMTGNGVGYVLEHTNTRDIFANNKVAQAYVWLMNIYPNTPADYRQNSSETYVEWYRRIAGLAQPLPTGECRNDDLPCLLTWHTRSYIVGTIDGRNSTYPPQPLPVGDSLYNEISDNVMFSASHLKATQAQLLTKVENDLWDSLSPADQWLLTLVAYNAGENQGVLDAIISVTSQGEKPEWDVIRPILKDKGLEGTAVYAEDILQYAMQGGN